MLLSLLLNFQFHSATNPLLQWFQLITMNMTAVQPHNQTYLIKDHVSFT